MRKRLFIILMVMAGLALLASSPAMAAGTAAGSLVQNRAYVDYKDANGNNLPRVYSDYVTTVVSQVAAVSLTPPASTKPGEKGGVVDFGVTVRNDGNGNDTFDLAATPAPGFTATLYLDTNGNGVRDPGEDTVVTNTGSLPADGPFYLILEVGLPAGGINNGDTYDVTLTATSQFNPGVLATGTYTTLVQDAVLVVTKAVSPTSGVKPGDTLTYAVTGNNTGSATAQDVIITDAIPANTTYVAGSIRIGPVGGSYATASPRTDVNDGDNANYNVTTPGAITVNWGDAIAGDSGIVYFQVKVNLNVTSGTVVENRAAITYKVNGLLQPTLYSTMAQVAVETMPSVNLGSDASQTGNPSDQKVYPVSVCNTGNAADIFNITYTSGLGWAWTFWVDVDGNGIPGTDGDYLLTDTNGDGKIDTGSIPQGSCRAILAVATIPPGTADGATDTTIVTATSVNDPNVSDSKNLVTTVTAPHLTITKAVSPTGNQPPGTDLTYTVTVANTGTGIATTVVIADMIPMYTAYKAGSISSGATAGTLTPRSDALDGDGAGYNGTTNSVVVPDGGPLTLGVGGTWVLQFTVTIQ